MHRKYGGPMDHNESLCRKTFHCGEDLTQHREAEHQPGVEKEQGYEKRSPEIRNMGTMITSGQDGREGLCGNK